MTLAQMNPVSSAGPTDPNLTDPTQTGPDRYRLIGPVYDFLSTLYSGRQIYNAKVAMNDYLKGGDRVLFAGAGHGLDAIDAARRGARVTVVDLSPTMLKGVEKNAMGIQIRHPIRFVHSDILAFDALGEYDHVVANFFLNVFSRAQMVRVLAHLGDLVKPGGHLVVGDFQYPRGPRPIRVIQNLYWYMAVVPFTLFAKNAFHKIYNYPEFMAGSGFTIKEIRSFKVMLLPMLWSVRGVKGLDRGDSARAGGR